MSGVLVTRRVHEGIEFFTVGECGKKLDAAVLSWLVIWALNNSKNLKYQIDGGWNKIGSKGFMEAQL